ncbi:MAG: hypothetical protein ACR2PT_23770 [Endozoicomonas sp.]
MNHNLKQCRDELGEALQLADSCRQHAVPTFTQAALEPLVQHMLKSLRYLNHHLQQPAEPSSRPTLS